MFRTYLTLGHPVAVRAPYLVLTEDGPATVLWLDITYDPTGDGSGMTTVFQGLVGPKVPNTGDDPVTLQEFRYEIDAALAHIEPSNIVIEGKSGYLMAALHHRLAVAAYYDSSLAKLLLGVFCTGALDGETVNRVEGISEKVDAIINVVNKGKSGVVIIPSKNVQELAATRSWERDPVETDLLRDEDREKQLFVKSVDTLAQAEAIAFGKDLARVRGGAARRAQRLALMRQWMPRFAFVCVLGVAIELMLVGVPTPIEHGDQFTDKRKIFTEWLPIRSGAPWSWTAGMATLLVADEVYRARRFARNRR